jgi:hypothetical protein
MMSAVKNIKAPGAIRATPRSRAGSVCPPCYHSSSECCRTPVVYNAVITVLEAVQCFVIALFKRYLELSVYQSVVKSNAEAML